MTFKPVYKCRLCGIEYDGLIELDCNINELIPRLVGLDDYQGYYVDGYSISIVTSHICNGGNIGIAELKGFVKR